MHFRSLENPILHQKMHSRSLGNPILVSKRHFKTSSQTFATIPRWDARRNTSTRGLPSKLVAFRLAEAWQRPPSGNEPSGIRYPVAQINNYGHRHGGVRRTWRKRAHKNLSYHHNRNHRQYLC